MQKKKKNFTVFSLLGGTERTFRYSVSGTETEHQSVNVSIRAHSITVVPTLNLI